MEPTLPKVRVVVLNFDGGTMTLDCLDSLLATDWPADRLEIVMVDNGSVDDVVERVGADPRYASIIVLEPLANLGFAGGCNLGMRREGDHDLVALINNDATVDPGWLRAMVAALGQDDRIGAVNAKLLFADRYHGVELDVTGARRYGRDGRILGARITGVRLDDQRVDERLVYDEGIHGQEGPLEEFDEEIARWTSAHGAVRVKAIDGERPSSISLRLRSIDPVTVVVTSDVDRQEITVGREPVWVTVAIPPEPFDVVNNVGSNLFAGGHGGDRGFLEVDRGQYAAPADVFAWCGGAVLLRRTYLDEVGLFDERLFLYYEDTDLSWRGRIQGWRYVYAPGALVRHRHAASSGVGSPVFAYYTQRNRLLVLAKNAPVGLALRAGLGEVKRFAITLVRHYAIRPLTLRLPVRAEVAHRWKVLRGYLQALPATIAERRAMPVVETRESLMTWAVTK
ncbi:MAG: glycosyltransferase family 2 protein [Ilumatobacteraceae bacterium]